MTTPLIIIIVSCSIILALCMVYFIRKIVKLCRNLQYKKAERRQHAALEEKYGAPLTEAAARLLREPAEKKRAELAAFIRQVRQLPPDLLAEAENWEAAPAVPTEKEGALVFDMYSLIRKENELLLIQKVPNEAKRYFICMYKAREAVPAFKDALASKEEGAVDAAIIAHWEDFSPLQSAKEVYLLSMDDVAYFSISEQTTTTQTQTSSVDRTKMPGKLGTMTNEVLFGSAYATAKAVQKANSATRTETTVRTDTKRTATLYFNPACGRPPLLFSGDNVNALEAMMPEKRK